ncbi:hypothetical protein Tco_0895632 [Tanacetum coccineum]|uniref:DNA-directed DNA polymerase n=1 Tax=Tanacetum coccineum TaxID=301880 RepID=A0ABQ5CF61_9ASTR
MDFSIDINLIQFYNALNINDQDSLNSAAGGNFWDKMPRECLKIIESKSKVRQTRAKAVVAKVGKAFTSDLTPTCMTLELRIDQFLKPNGNCKRHLVNVGVFHFSSRLVNGSEAITYYLESTSRSRPITLHRRQTQDDINEWLVRNTLKKFLKSILECEPTTSHSVQRNFSPRSPKLSLKSVKLITANSLLMNLLRLIKDASPFEYAFLAGRQHSCTSLLLKRWMLRNKSSSHNGAKIPHASSRLENFLTFRVSTRYLIPKDFLMEETMTSGPNIKESKSEIHDVIKKEVKYFLELDCSYLYPTVLVSRFLCTKEGRKTWFVNEET